MSNALMKAVWAFCSMHTFYFVCVHIPALLSKLLALPKPRVICSCHCIRACYLTVQAALLGRASLSWGMQSTGFALPYLQGQQEVRSYKEIKRSALSYHIAPMSLVPLCPLLQVLSYMFLLHTLSDPYSGNFPQFISFLWIAKFLPRDRTPCT